MTSRIRRQLTAVTVLFLAHPIAPTMAVERPMHTAEIRAPWTPEATTDAEPTSQSIFGLCELVCSSIDGRLAAQRKAVGGHSKR